MPFYLYFFFLLFVAQIQVMEFKFLPMIAIMVAMFPVPNEASLRWVKLNKSPVCFGAKGDDFGRFSYHGNIFVKSFKLVHLSGKVSCLKEKDAYSYWGCYPRHRPNLGAILTDHKNNILAPDASTVQSTGWYNLPGYSSSSPELVFEKSGKPHVIFANNELRLWYGEDLRGRTEEDNDGKTCAEVYGLLDMVC